MATATGNRCECGKAATFIVLVYEQRPQYERHTADYYWAVCDAHLTRDTRRCAAQAGVARPYIVLRPERAIGGGGDRDV